MRRWMLAGGVLGAAQMIVFATVAGALRPGYDASRNWISQLSLGPGGWLATLNLATCGLWVIVGAGGLRHRLGPGWTARLVFWCGGCLIALALVPTDPGIGYPPDVPTAHTQIGRLHLLVALTLGLAGIGAAALLGRDVRAVRAGRVVAAIVAVAFVAGSVLVVLDDAGVTPGAPSGVLERVALFTGFGWIGWVSATLLVRPASGASGGRGSPRGADAGAGAGRGTAR
jgi:hypothetical membrane protein